jgi:ABC-type branched-subunit amino acid transport system permease subunit
LTLLPEILHGVKEYNVLVYGFILMAVLMFFPEGLFPAIRSVAVAAIRKKT